MADKRLKHKCVIRWTRRCGGYWRSLRHILLRHRGISHPSWLLLQLWH